ncbi:2,3-bisphosphoglycerate-dependent phosphoglycerate mutase [Cellulosimicrobium cellulans]|uniref:2,3-bisphosphoglycerate-dependent phosphoglycerate mutase n=1 Tax=Cellulosimicrobium cellulans TaxID=1710 RepID=UPI0009F42DBE|nr:2,3-bisphosphoglycerate-dependent phosphoglycerate mutase [Cellulosimicrobium cellulans]
MPDDDAAAARPAAAARGAASGPGILVLLRHGQSTYNAEDRFTGLLDVPLSERGVDEARRAGDLLAHALVRHPELTPRRVITSPLVRASATAAIVAEALPGPPPVEVAWRLVERHYGAFTDTPRAVVRSEHGEEAFWRYRRSYAHRPPPLAPDAPARADVDAVLARLPDDARAALRPDTESLADVVDRLRPFWDGVRAALLRGETLLVVGHGNSLRALSVLVDGLAPEEVRDLDVPTGHPLVRRFLLEQARPGRGTDEDAGGTRLVPLVRGGTYLDADGAEHAIADLRARGGT